MITDFDSFFRNKIECLLIKTSWVEKVQQRLALEAVSQVWCDRPEWYLWIRGAPGVYALALADAETVAAGRQVLQLGRFTLKCYPYPDGAALAGFSAEEQAAVESDLFDGTHTPRVEARDRIPDAWFTVGSVSVLLDERQTVALLTYDSLEQMRLYSSPAKGPETISASAGNSGGRLIRNVPGWKLGYRFFDCLTGLYAFYSRQAPCFVGAAGSPGFTHILDAENRLHCRSTGDTRQLALAVLFMEAGGQNDQADTLWRKRLDPEEEVFFTATFTQAVTRPIEIPELPATAVNPLWWELAYADYKSEKTTTCGCADHEHHTCHELPEQHGAVLIDGKSCHTGI